MLPSNYSRDDPNYLGPLLFNFGKHLVDLCCNPTQIHCSNRWSWRLWGPGVGQHLWDVVLRFIWRTVRYSLVRSSWYAFHPYNIYVCLSSEQVLAPAHRYCTSGRTQPRRSHSGRTTHSMLTNQYRRSAKRTQREKFCRISLRTDLRNLLRACRRRRSRWIC